MNIGLWLKYNWEKFLDGISYRNGSKLMDGQD